MLLLTGPEIVNLAMKKLALNQRNFSKLLGKSQSQVSKYLTGSCDIPGDVSIRCMNIISNTGLESDSHMELLFKVLKLQGEESRPLRRALLEMINAWNGKIASKKDEHHQDGSTYTVRT